ncbi:MAG: cache domain-containing protein [Candidatus Nanopelagicales bacterium]
METDDVVTAKPESTRRQSRLTLSWRVSLLIAVLLVLSAIASILFAVHSIRNELSQQSREAVSNVHASVSAAVQAEFDGIDLFRDQTLERRKQSLRDVAAPLVVALDELYASEKAGELTKEQTRSRALALLTAVRFADNDYFFTYDLDLTAIGHPDERFQGRNLADMQDADGKYFIREARDLVLDQGSGYIDYRWERLNGAEPSPKVGYVFLYEPWDWMIGTGVYVDDIEAEVDRQVEGISRTLEQTFEEISFSGDGFFFIVDRSGEIVASGSPFLTSAMETDAGQEAIASILAEAPAQPGVEVEQTVSAPWASDDSTSWSVRTSTSGGDLDWVLVSAVSEEQLEAPGRDLALQLTGLALVVLLIGLALGILVSRRITKPVDDITKAARDLADGSFDPASLDAAARRSDEVGDLARSFQAMGTEIVERERRLREQVEKLSVQINRAKVAAEVQEITESDYFQSLKARSRELRDRDD